MDAIAGELQALGRLTEVSVLRFLVVANLRRLSRLAAQSGKEDV